METESRVRYKLRSLPHNRCLQSNNAAYDYRYRCVVKLTANKRFCIVLGLNNYSTVVVTTYSKLTLNLYSGIS